MKILVQVTSSNNDRFFSIEKDELRRVSGLAPEARRAAFYQAAEPAKVHSTDECDFFLVLDGHEDDESWGDLMEEMSSDL